YFMLRGVLSFSGPVLDFIWVLMLGAFFFAGRHAWAALVNAYGSGVYEAFRRGNTSILFMMPALYCLGILLDSPDLMHRILGLYFAVHFMLVGVSILKIEADMAKYGKKKRAGLG
ncbi:hypothetical protein, partial [Ectothiorhodospira lacustris]|uniref:hypothetical protein n=1 Tax=Ectothiorhodospira lacustris TaxID=2899127 RepID=UPI001EE94DF6